MEVKQERRVGANRKRDVTSRARALHRTIPSILRRIAPEYNWTSFISFYLMDESI
jgi:hypothetical protein